MASERLGEYLLSKVKDEERARHSIGKAIEHYKNWGALAKVDQLSTKYSTMWKVPNRIAIG